jgi:hypothetical protein
MGQSRLNGFALMHVHYSLELNMKKIIDSFARKHRRMMLNDIISPDIIDVALSYSIAGIKVVLEIPFEIRAEFEKRNINAATKPASINISAILSQILLISGYFSCHNCR